MLLCNVRRDKTHFPLGPATELPRQGAARDGENAHLFMLRRREAPSRSTAQRLGALLLPLREKSLPPRRRGCRREATTDEGASPLTRPCFAGPPSPARGGGTRNGHAPSLPVRGRSSRYFKELISSPVREAGCRFTGLLSCRALCRVGAQVRPAQPTVFSSSGQTPDRSPGRLGYRTETSGPALLSDNGARCRPPFPRRRGVGLDLSRGSARPARAHS
jgi:hypothetical protein